MVDDNSEVSDENWPSWLIFKFLAGWAGLVKLTSEFGLKKFPEFGSIVNSHD